MAIKQSRGITIGKGTPQRLEGQNGDMTIRSSRRGLKLYVKESNKWHSLDLGIDLRQIASTVRRLEDEVKRLSTKTNNTPVVDKILLRESGGTSAVAVQNKKGAVSFRSSTDGADAPVDIAKTGTVSGGGTLTEGMALTTASATHSRFTSVTTNALLSISGTNTDVGDIAIGWLNGATKRWLAGFIANDVSKFYISSGSSLADPEVTIVNNGNVGIGTDSPAETLEVVGDFAVRGSELIDNHTFTSDLSDWTLSGDTPPTYVSGNMQMNSDGSTFSTARQSFTTVVGVTYVASGNITVHGSSNKIEIGTSAGASDNLNYTTTGTGTFTQTFTATATTTHIEVQDGGGGTGNTYSEVSVRQIATIYTDKTNNRLGIGTTSPTTTLDVNGTANFSGDVTLPDSSSIKFGNGEDLQIRHNGSDSFIIDSGTGDMYIRGATNLFLQAHSTNETFFKGVSNGAVELYYNNSKTFETTSTGVNIEGTVSYKHTAFSTTGPTNLIDVSATTILEVDTSSNNVTIGGFAGGVQGQVLYIVKTDTTNFIQLEHNESPAAGDQQRIFLTSGADERVVGYGGYTLYCNGDDWYSLSNPTGAADAG